MPDGIFRWGPRGEYYKYDDAQGGIYVMAHIFTEKCIQLTLRGSDEQGNLLLNVFHAQSPVSPITETELTAATTAVADFVHAAYSTLVPSTITFTDVTAIALDVAAPAPKHVQVIGIDGSRVGLEVPGSVTLSLIKNCNRTGRKSRGGLRVFPACTTDMVDANFFTADYVTAAVGAFNALLADLLGQGTPLVVRSTVGNFLTVVDNFQARNLTIDSQKTRLAGHGR